MSTQLKKETIHDLQIIMDYQKKHHSNMEIAKEHLRRFYGLEDNQDPCIEIVAGQIPKNSINQQHVSCTMKAYVKTNEHEKEWLEIKVIKL